MFYGDTVTDTRALFFGSWKKYRQKKALLPLEQQIVDVVLMHPEYHDLLDAGESVQAAVYFPELGQSNPFLHMGLHLAIREQVATDRPAGITALYKALLHHYADPSTVEHLIMEPLGECLWQAQRDQSMPNDVAYLGACKRLLP